MRDISRCLAILWRNIWDCTVYAHQHSEFSNKLHTLSKITNENGDIAESRKSSCRGDGVTGVPDGLHSAMTAQAPKSKVLDEYYQSVTTLSTYLDALIPSLPHQWTKADDPESFHQLLSTTRVGISIPFETIPQLSFYPPACSQNEIMDRVHARLFKKTRRPNNVLAFGYRATGSQGKLESQNVKVSSYVPNSMEKAP
ncbi:hypothetical protein M408DRAFT_165828 [Serendipita vermifera MAFF 305830]|uniref:Uncharacterized protein n=1 Tax=Serendipita vermifera MAFF 305830 TaxID=933852 RepID=A0A0C3B7T2_SERVB|nr:hypothetical protein M408DRAFT_165828 [Serendipita vermifera MAFF 305830]